MTEAHGFGGEPIYTSVEYDGLGRKTFESIPSFDENISVGTSYSSYDALGRLTYKETDRANSGVMTTQYSYDGHTTNITATDGSILTMSRTYGTDGKLIQTVDAKQGKTRYAYDSRGNPITLEDANSEAIHAWHNGFGHKWKVDDPNMGVKTFGYNTYGEVESEIDANGDKVTHQYDSLGRVLLREVNDTKQASFIFDGATNGVGLLSYEESGDFERSYTYDNYSRAKTTTTVIDSTSYTSEAFYDGVYGRVKAYQYASGIKVGYDYDPYGYQTTTYNVGSNFVYQNVEQRDARLNVLKAFKNYSDDLDDYKLREERTYALASGQLTMIDLKTEFGGAEQKHNLGYIYGDFGNLDSQEQWHPGGSNTETYVYDSLHRLIHSQSTTYGNIDYEYDAVGNLTKKSDYASVISYGVADKSNTANAGPNAIKSITQNGTVVDDFLYDNNGNLEEGSGKSISYNAFNKPIIIDKGTARSRFYYGSDLSRFKHIKTKAGQTDETTLYVGKEVEVVKSSGITTTKTYIDDIAIVEKEEMPNQVLADHRIRFTHRDRLGSVITLTDHLNNITEQRSYDAFGKPRNADLSPGLSATLLGTNDNFSVFTPRGFTDHEHLDDAELIHMNGRAYDYNLGRFLSVDPFIQAPGNSQSMNPYSYIMNNPLAGTDPSGYTSSCISPSSLACQYDSVDEGNTDPFATSCVLTCIDVSSGNGSETSNSSKSSHAEETEQLMGQDDINSDDTESYMHQEAYKQLQWDVVEKSKSNEDIVLGNKISDEDIKRIGIKRLEKEVNLRRGLTSNNDEFGHSKRQDAVLLIIEDQKFWTRFKVISGIKSVDKGGGFSVRHAFVGTDGSRISLGENDRIISIIFGSVDGDRNSALWHKAFREHIQSSQENISNSINRARRLNADSIIYIDRNNEYSEFFRNGSYSLYNSIQE
ncbi:MAG: hypothetical protein CMP47_09125 [Rickettsiales bacterium]|nr:hypothetical protein [Rickettsiales bacterium]